MGIAGNGTEATEDIGLGTGVSREELHSIGSCVLSFRCRRIPQIQFLEAIHEETDAGTRSTHHFGERFLGDLWNHRFRFILLAEVRQQKKYPGQPFFAGIEETSGNSAAKDINSGREDIELGPY